jgi:hypothetical protein
MKISTIPVFSSLALASMSAAVFSHWWTVNEFATAVGASPGVLPAAALPASAPGPILAAAPAAAVPVNQAVATVSKAKDHPAQTAQPSVVQKEFYASMLDEMRLIRKENTALKDQMAETNRDLMKLEFRVDTHSESFRPLKVAEDDATLDAPVIDDGPGVLPPRPEVAGLPELE